MPSSSSIWLEIIKAAVPWIGALLAFLISRSTKGGADDVKLTAVCGEVKKLQAARAQQGESLAQITAIHALLTQSLTEIKGRVNNMADDISWVRGKIGDNARGGRHG